MSLTNILYLCSVINQSTLQARRGSTNIININQSSKVGVMEKTSCANDDMKLRTACVAWAAMVFAHGQKGFGSIPYLVPHPLLYAEQMFRYVKTGEMPEPYIDTEHKGVNPAV